MTGYDALVLAGGAGRRLGGIDKPGLRVAGVPLLERVVRACAGAARVVVVGPARSLPIAVTWAREEPPGGGPVSGLAAGLPFVTAPVVLVLAADLPFLSAAALSLLVTRLEGCDAALAVDATGRDQLLLAAWRSEALRAALPLPAAGARARDLYGGGVRVRRVPMGSEPWVTTDCDTVEELARAEDLAGAGDVAGAQDHAGAEEAAHLPSTVISGRDHRGAAGPPVAIQPPR